MESLSRYSIKRKINSGGMATVFLAEDTQLKRDVAIKRIHPHLLERPEAIRRFNNEAKIIASLSHENIITVFDYGEDDHERYLVMEYIDGPTLLEVLETYNAFPNLVLLDILVQILRALEAAHSQGIYHRDIKPDNIIVDKKGCAHLMDFGIAYLVNQESLTLTGSFVGSPSYICPEQVLGEKITDKSDIFSFGSLCYACATENIPFNADNPSAIFNRVVNEEPLAPMVKNPELLHWLSDFIEVCLQKDPQKRPDVKQCLHSIGDACDLYGLELDRNRFGQFVKDPDGYRSQEKVELYGIYQKIARENYHRKKYVTVLKNLDQMRSFCELAPEDIQLQQKIKNRGRIQKTLLYTAIAIVAFAGIFVLFENVPSFYSKSKSSLEEEEKDTASISPAIAQDTSSDVIPGIFPETDNAQPGINTVVNPVTKPVILQAPAIAPEKKAIISIPEFGYLHLRTKPPWVTVIIDNIKIGETPKTGIIQLKPGKHELILEKPGFQKERQPIYIHADDTLDRKILMVQSGR